VLVLLASLIKTENGLTRKHEARRWYKRNRNEPDKVMVVPVHVMKAHGRVEVQLQPFLPLA
jgi:hypothetical protein